MTVSRERANEIKRKETAKSGLCREFSDRDFSQRERERLYLKKRQTNEAKVYRREKNTIKK